VLHWNKDLAMSRWHVSPEKRVSAREGCFIIFDKKRPLIAASESPHLLSGIMDYLDSEVPGADTISVADSAQSHVERMRSLIKMLHLK
jgi:hypothetical protein